MHAVEAANGFVKYTIACAHARKTKQSGKIVKEEDSIIRGGYRQANKASTNRKPTGYMCPERVTTRNIDRGMRTRHPCPVESLQEKTLDAKVAQAVALCGWLNVFSGRGRPKWSLSDTPS
jgi:hypothetical protein